MRQDRANPERRLKTLSRSSFAGRLTEDVSDLAGRVCSICADVFDWLTRQPEPVASRAFSGDTPSFGFVGAGFKKKAPLTRLHSR